MPENIEATENVKSSIFFKWGSRGANFVRGSVAQLRCATAAVAAATAAGVAAAAADAA